MPPEIRRLLPADAPAYRTLRLEALARHPESFGSSAEEEAQPGAMRFEQAIEAQDPEAFVVGAFDGPALVGMCGFVREKRAKTRHRGLLVSVYVQAAYRGQGLARQLLAVTLGEAFEKVGVEQVELGVIDGNEAARRLYEQAGFVEFGFARNYLKINTQYYHERLMVLMRPGRLG